MERGSCDALVIGFASPRAVTWTRSLRCREKEPRAALLRPSFPTHMVGESLS